MTDKVRHIAARIGGKPVRFELKRAHLPAFEDALGGSAYTCLKRFLDDGWRATDVSLVLSFAWKGPTEEETHLSSLIRRMEAEGLASAPLRIITDMDVAKLIDANGPARYAELAMSILVAALMGIDPDVAVFDDEAVDA